MCGIVGGLTKDHKIKNIILDGLINLEYRGYDSAGIAILNDNNLFNIIKQIGAPSLLNSNKGLNELSGDIGLGHNRWATHGKVNHLNAHPHIIGSDEFSIALVHNGVLENLSEFQEKLSENTKKLLKSTTDSEIIAAYLYQLAISGLDFDHAFKKTIDAIEGQFALLVINSKNNAIYGARRALPLFYSSFKDNHIFSSDTNGFPREYEKTHLIIEEDILKVSKQTGPQYLSGSDIDSYTKRLISEQVDKSKYHSFMEKEIFEQAQIINHHFIEEYNFLNEFFIQNEFNEVHLIGCGTSYHAASIAVLWFARLAGIRAQSFIASEFRYFPPCTGEKSLLIAISQSGETADVIAAVTEHRKLYKKVLSICNVNGSLLTQLVDIQVPLMAGKEIGVASTKAFTAQLIALMKVILISRGNTLGSFAEKIMIPRLPHQINELLNLNHFDIWAKELSGYSAMMILGRGPLYPIAMEGALKLKEIAYIHVHALPSSELKHGSLALIDDRCPVIVMIPNDHFLKKNILTCEEIAARSGRLYLIVEEGVDHELLPEATRKITIPSGDVFNPILFVIPFQLLAMKIANFLGHNIDKPRNLAKSVTVE